MAGCPCFCGSQRVLDTTRMHRTTNTPKTGGAVADQATEGGLGRSRQNGLVCCPWLRVQAGTPGASMGTGRAPPPVFGASPAKMVQCTAQYQQRESLPDHQNVGVSVPAQSLCVVPRLVSSVLRTRPLSPPIPYPHQKGREGVVLAGPLRNGAFSGWVMQSTCCPPAPSL